jgi:hypothetical protein
MAIDDNLCEEVFKQKLCMDVMHIDGMKFLVTIVDPTQLTIYSPKMILRDARCDLPCYILMCSCMHCLCRHQWDRRLSS